MKKELRENDTLSSVADKFAKRAEPDAVEEYLIRSDDHEDETLVVRINAVLAKVDPSLDRALSAYQAEMFRRIEY